MTIYFDNLPAVRLKTRLRIISEPAFDITIDRDAIVIIEEDQLAKT